MADTNVWVSGVIAPLGVCGQVLRTALAQQWEPVASPTLIDELAEVLARQKFRRWLTVEEAEQFVAGVSGISDIHPDPDPGTAMTTADPDDDYLVALAQGVDGVVALVSGDPHLKDLVDLQPPVMTPAAFLAFLGE